MFNNLTNRNGIEVGQKDREVAIMMNTYWANFAKTGNPNSKELPQWNVYSTGGNELLEIRRDGSAVSVPDPKKARLDVIEKVAKSIK